jgi:hypothetical protein
MDWGGDAPEGGQAGEPMDGGDGVAGMTGVRIRPLRDVLLAYQAAGSPTGTPAVLLRVLRRVQGAF